MSLKAKRLGGWLMVLLLSVASRAAGGDLRLADAVKNRDKEAVRALLKERAGVNTPQPDGATALHWAAHWDDLETADLLIRAGAHVNAANDLGVTPLSLACLNGNAVMVEKLLKAGANPNAARATGETALMTAARTGNWDAVKALLARGAEVNAKETSRGQTALMWAVAERHLEIARSLIDHGSDVRATSNSGFTALMFAAREGDVEAARMLLSHGATVNEAAVDGSTPLLVATVRGHTAFAEFLLDRGADPNADGAGYTALHWAAGTWEASVSGAFGVTAKSSEWSGLGGLKGQAKLEFMKVLLAHGANPNARLTKNPPRFGHSVGFTLKLAGGTPFLLAALAGDASVMRVLAEAGADPLVATDDKMTPLVAAAGIARIVGVSLVTESSALEAIKLAMELGGNVNAANESGDTALHGAAYEGRDTIVQFLAEHGAKVNVKNKSGVTPLMIAEGKGPRVAATNIFHPSTADLLRKLGGDTESGRD